MNFDLLFDEAVIAIQQVQNNRIFTLKDLFEGHRWNELAVGDRLGFGRFFKNKVIHRSIPDVVYIGKAANNSAQYKKTEEVTR